MSEWMGKTGFVLAIGLVAYICLSVPGVSQVSNPAHRAGGLHVVSTALPSGLQELTIVDPTIPSVAIYHVDTNGRLLLRSVRNIRGDLRMEEFNTQSPLPSELRALQP